MAPPRHYFGDIIDGAAMHYEPQPYPGDIALFQPFERPAIFDYRPGREEVVDGELAVYDVPGGHHTMPHESNVRALAKTLRAALDRAQARHGKPA